MKNIVTKLKSFPRDTRRDLGNYLIVVAAFLLMQAALGGGLISNSMEGLLVPICAYVVMAISLTLTVGILGELSLGHGGFMSVGAFVGVFFSMATQNSIPSDGMRLFLAFVAGTVAAGVVGLLIGIPVLRLRGDYLAIVTLAFGEIIKNVLNVLYVGVDANGIHVAISDEKALHLAEDGRVIIAGALGISGGRKLATFVIGFVLVLVALFIVQNLVRSRAGRAIMSIRDNRIAAEAMGINVTKYKLMAFSISAALAGAAGVLYGHNYSALQAGKFNYNMSIQVLLFVVLGGMTSLRGAMIAAVVLTVLPEMLRGLEDYRMLIYAIVLIAVMIFNQSPQLIQWRARMAEKLPKFGRKKEKEAK
ncbi:MAG TPA: branched-chain amino acid ABC transporter permease [Candidatus Anaerofilum faecale]|nr:branched-chain amino acid ABC transporter permease [Anaerofilum sp. An201]OUP03918.1 amino acid ABC transporter permease [Anaerofilum sp. An201]HIX13035.1 branched-chain amino acid ABC transporter permease [Candidatus Anaerofilum faecale]